MSFSLAIERKCKLKLEYKGAKLGGRPATSDKASGQRMHRWSRALSWLAGDNQSAHLLADNCQPCRACRQRRPGERQMASFALPAAGLIKRLRVIPATWWRSSGARALSQRHLQAEGRPTRR